MEKADLIPTNKLSDFGLSLLDNLSWSSPGHPVVVIIAVSVTAWNFVVKIFYDCN
jgi:hypothetical protein